MAYYGLSGDIRADLNGGLPSTHNNYQGEGQISGALIERGRRYAYSVINGKLLPTYPDSIPWASGSEPNLIYEISNKLTQCFVLNAKNVGNEPLDKKKRQDLCIDPMDLLDDIANLEVQLVGEENPIGSNNVYHTRKDYTPVADMDSIDNQQIDPDLLDDIKDDRDS